MKHTAVIKNSIRALIAFMIVLAAWTLPPQSASADPVVRYAAPTSQGSGDCSSWADACSLQSALDGAAAEDEVWVKAGIYKPTTNPTARSAKFTIVSGLLVYGGFSGDETSRAQRDWQTNLTILSGDIDGDDTNTDGNFIAETTADLQGANSYNVVTLSNAGSSTVFDGSVVTAGMADSTAAGVSNYYGSPQLSNLLIVGNKAAYAAGMQNNQSSPTLTNIVFLNNTATSDIGGLQNYYGCDVQLTNVAFIGNSAGGGGGAMGNYICTVTVNNGLFYDNHAAGGGAIASNQSNIYLQNATFFDNSATTTGGGISAYFSGIYLRNVVMWGDQAASLSEIQNVRDKYGDYTSSINVYYSDVQGCGGSSAWAGGDFGNNGGGNIDTNPLFLDSANGNLRLSLTSPAVDDGRNSDVPEEITTDLDGLARFVDIASVTDTGSGTPPIVDMGAYETHVDETAPSVVSITRLDPTPTSLASVRFLVTFSEPVSSLDVADFSPSAVGLSGAAVSGISGGPAVYQVTVNTGAGSGQLRLDLPEDADITDLRLNPLGGLPYTSSEVYTIDKTAPAVVSITRLDPSPTNLESVDYQVTFSESVINLDRSDFYTVSTGIGDASLEEPLDSGDHIHFTAQVGTGTGNGTLQLRVYGDADISDPAGNLLSGLPFTDGEVYEIYKGFAYMPVIVR